MLQTGEIAARGTSVTRLVEEIVLKFSPCLSSLYLLHIVETLQAINCHKHRAHFPFSGIIIISFLMFSALRITVSSILPEFFIVLSSWLYLVLIKILCRKAVIFEFDILFYMA